MSDLTYIYNCKGCRGKNCQFKSNTPTDLFPPCFHYKDPTVQATWKLVEDKDATIKRLISEKDKKDEKIGELTDGFSKLKIEFQVKPPSIVLYRFPSSFRE